jgi:hypothetical protein
VKKLNHFSFGAALLAAAAGCGGEDNSGPLGDVDALVVLQRPLRNDMGDIFQYTSYIPGARLVKLTPPTADGQLEVLFPHPEHHAEFTDVDINGYDISFDATQIVFAARTGMTPNYGLYVLNLDDNSVRTLPTDPSRDYVAPFWVPGEKIVYTTNAVANDANPQHEDEYERGVTLQLGRIDASGANDTIAPRNLSHRTFPSLQSDGTMIMTQWDHLGPMNAGHLIVMNPDFTNMKEAWGKEGTGASNSTIKAREIAPGRYVAIATARDRTIQAGALIDIRLGDVANQDGVISADRNRAEARATYHLLTPDVPTDNAPSSDTIGRYYDAFPLNAKEKPDLLVSWADGPVESSVLGAAGLSAQFGVYLLDTERGQRRPILDDPAMWDIFARPLKTRTAPPLVSSSIDPDLGGAAMIGSLNAYETSIASFEAGSIYGMRVLEGFSSEEGPRMFGTTMFEGQAQLGVAPLANDGSWLAKVPAGVPLHLQAIDEYGLTLQNEPVWFSAAAGEQRVCGGCHEDRTGVTSVNPGQLEAFSIGPVEMFSNVERANRQSLVPFTRDTIMGVPWGTAAGSPIPVNRTVQNIFNTKCVSCHGPDNVAGIAGYTITDPVTGESIPWTFDLSDRVVAMNVGGVDLGEWPASYISMVGPDMEAIAEGDLMITGNFRIYLDPQNSAGSFAIQKLNPPQQFPVQDLGNRRFKDTTPHMQEVGGTELTPDEFYALILAADSGGNFYSRENIAQ